MKNLIKLTLCMALAFILITTSGLCAFLDEYSINDETSEVTIKGSIDGAKENDSITIQILRSGITADDVEEFYESGEALIGDFIFFTQIPANEDGAYEEVFSMAGEEAGFYSVRVNGADAGEIYFTSKESREFIVKEIKDNCEDASVSEAVAYLKENFVLHTEDGEDNTESIWLSTFAITESLTFRVSESGLFGVFVLFVDDLTVDNFKNLFTDATYIAAVNEGKIDLVENADIFGLDEKYVTSYKEKITNEDFMKEYFIGENLTTKEDIAAAFKDAVLMDMLNSFVGWKDVKDYIENYGEAAGVDMKTYNSSKFKGSMKSELYEYLLDEKPFSSLKDFADKANDKMDDLLDPKPSGSGGGGGKGFSGGSFKSEGTLVTNPVVPTETLPEEPQTEDTPAEKFGDLQNVSWAKESIEALAQKGIVSGTGNGNFEPERNVNREEILVMILKAFSVEASSGSSGFADASAGAWYDGFLAAARDKNFVSGKPDGTFGVGEAITREDAAVIAYNVAKAMGKTFDTAVADTFADHEEISGYASEAVYALKNAGVISGKDGGAFAPKATCTRAEAARIVYTLISK